MLLALYVRPMKRTYSSFLRKYPYCSRHLYAAFLVDYCFPILDLYAWATIDDVRSLKFLPDISSNAKIDGLAHTRSGYRQGGLAQSHSCRVSTREVTQTRVHRECRKVYLESAESMKSRQQNHLCFADQLSKRPLLDR